jgi:hypothetical protein
VLKSENFPAGPRGEWTDVHFTECREGDVFNGFKIVEMVHVKWCFEHLCCSVALVTKSPSITLLNSLVHQISSSTVAGSKSSSTSSQASSSTLHMQAQDDEQDSVYREDSVDTQVPSNDCASRHDHT